MANAKKNDNNRKDKKKSVSDMKPKKRFPQKAGKSPGHYAKMKEQQKQERKEKLNQRNLLREQKAAEIEAERARAKQEKEERIKIYKKKRLEKTKALSKRTQRGQPLMKDRMQLLLKQIQEMKSNK